MHGNEFVPPPRSMGFKPHATGWGELTLNAVATLTDGYIDAVG